MGKTVAPFSQVLTSEQQRLSKFRRALREEDQAVFDTLFDQARLHIQAAVYTSNPDPAESFFLSILIEHWKIIAQLEERVGQLEAQARSTGSINGQSKD